MNTKSLERSRQARNFEPIDIAARPECEVDDWLVGFGCARAQIWRLHHDGQMFESAGLDDFDLQALRAAVNGALTG